MLGTILGSNMMSTLEKTDKRQVSRSQKTVKVVAKKARQINRRAKKRIEDLTELANNPNYGPGLF